MTEWIDDNTIKGELSAAEFRQKVIENMKARIAKEQKEGKPGNYGNDGYVTVYQELRRHNGTSYWLRVIRYFAVSRPDFEPMGVRAINSIGKHVVVESPVEIPYDLKDFLDLSEFLYRDSLHSHQMDWTLKQQWEALDELAVSDCDQLDTLKPVFENKVKDLRSQLAKFIKRIARREKTWQQI